MTTDQKYEKALDIIQSLLNTYGCMTPQWEEARKLIDLERPLIPKEGKDFECNGWINGGWDVCPVCDAAISLLSVAHISQERWRRVGGVLHEVRHWSIKDLQKIYLQRSAEEIISRERV